MRMYSVPAREVTGPVRIPAPAAPSRGRWQVAAEVTGAIAVALFLIAVVAL